MNRNNNEKNSNEASAQDMVPANVRIIMKRSQLEGFTNQDCKLVIDATSIYANGFSQGYAMGKDRNTAE